MDWKNAFTPFKVSSTEILPELMLTHLASWGCITITGADRKSYLQGQITCNVVTLAPEQSTLSAHCDAKGKVWSVFRLFHHGEGFAMFQPHSAIETELRELKKYAIFSKVELLESTDIALGIMGKEADKFIDTMSSVSGDVRQVEGGTAVKISSERWLLLVTRAQAALLAESFAGQKVTEDLWNRFDIEAALPVVTEADQNEHIPQALNLQALNGISFNKGCYTGQETVARAKYRGINKRAMYIVKGNIDAPLPEGSMITLERSVSQNWRSAGHLMTHYSFSDNTAIGLIVLPNNLEEETVLRLADQPDTRWSVQPLPYSLDDE